jgi:hypothetical protein
VAVLTRHLRAPIAHAIRDQTLARKLNSLLQTLCSNAAQFFLAHSPYFTSCEPFCATNFSPLSGSFDTALKSSLPKPKPNNRDPRLRAGPIITFLLLRFCQFTPNEPPFYASKARMRAPFFAQNSVNSCQLCKRLRAAHVAQLSSCLCSILNPEFLSSMATSLARKNPLQSTKYPQAHAKFRCKSSCYINHSNLRTSHRLCLALRERRTLPTSRRVYVRLEVHLRPYCRYLPNGGKANTLVTTL